MVLLHGATDRRAADRSSSSPGNGTLVNGIMFNLSQPKAGQPGRLRLTVHAGPATVGRPDLGRGLSARVSQFRPDCVPALLTAVLGDASRRRSATRAAHPGL
ncbi:hypothetical protein OG559_25965 [Micromonospora sp. NBC_01405]|uniref:hypothetical protein n=1 Tax=Micromonospora sp. NBC_01405 TaxID=2903589 RepID=UPI00324D03CD